MQILPLAPNTPPHPNHSHQLLARKHPASLKGVRLRSNRAWLARGKGLGACDSRSLSRTRSLAEFRLKDCPSIRKLTIAVRVCTTTCELRPFASQYDCYRTTTTATPTTTTPVFYYYCYSSCCYYQDYYDDDGNDDDSITSDSTTTTAATTTTRTAPSTVPLLRTAVSVIVVRVLNSEPSNGRRCYGISCIRRTHSQRSLP